MPSVPFRTLALVGVAAAIALTSGATAAAATPVTTTTDPAAAAAGWLAQQLTDGNHLVFSFDGTTFDGGGSADVIYALSAAQSGKATIDRIVDYFQKHVETYVDIRNTDGFGPNDGGIGKTAIAAMVAGADPTSFGGYNLLQRLKDDECTATSSTCAATGAADNIFSSISESLVVLAEARGAAIDPKYAPSDDAVNYLLSLQCTDGGFTSETAGGGSCTPDPDATGYALMALHALGNQSAAITKAANWLESTRNSDGSWSAQGGENVDSTGLAAAGLQAAGRSAATSRAWLVGQEVTDGPTVGAGASRGALKYQGKFDPSSSVKGTADGMLGMTTGSDLATLTDTGASATTAVLALAPPAIGHASVHPGGAQTVTGTGFAADERVSAAVHSAPISVGSAKADKTGTVHLSFTVPASLPAGTHTVVLTGATSALTSQATFAVLAAGTPTGTSSGTPTVTSTAPVLAATGRAGQLTQQEVLLGVGCVIAGAGVLALARQRRRSSHRA